MSRLILKLSHKITEALHLPPGERLSRVRHELVLRLYQKGLLSFGKARELAEMNKWDFYSLLGDENIIRSYDLEELEEDLKTLETLG